MRHQWLVLGTIGIVAGLAACSPESDSVSEEDSTEASSAINAHASPVAICPRSAGGPSARCHAQASVNGQGNPLVTPSFSGGLTPADLQSAYSLPSGNAGAGVTVAVVDAYDHPYAEADLGVYRAQFGLPPCTTANGCFKKVNQFGGKNSLPSKNSSWALEIALDLDMVSATCPSCKILLVEAYDNSFDNLGTAVNTAVSLGAKVVSNSYGGSEFSGELADEAAYFNHPGVAITASSGDKGFEVEFPAASRYVTAVGGTTLTKVNGLWSEKAWIGAGSGCSQYIAKPAWQTDASCANRTVSDISAVADTATGVAVYNSYPYQNQKGWWVLGGTSVAAPIVAGIYALANHSVDAGSSFYSHPASLRDVTLGTNGSCGGSYLCAAAPGYDGPTGNGTPSGIGAF